eukprot:CAMPEP_0198302322 /NCGR_PEP_ID=MMETSP1449-20131203/54762_1 /TAXON_ID=420275 /ORGANISM="Attheya septentrionalis, Strain CCMP2084" /LENGTH=221 /DNA_ID=CAMNT_0044004637 /DNA_START=38 /DNA_END=703 /DNA_ORIENTATION=+
MNMQSKALLIALVAISCTGWNRVVEASLRQANYGLVSSANHHESLLSQKIRWLFASTSKTTTSDDDTVSGDDDDSSSGNVKKTTSSTTTTMATDDSNVDDSITTDDTKVDDSPSGMKTTTSNSTTKSASNKTTTIEDDDSFSGTSTNATKDDESDDYVLEYDLTNTTKKANSTKINIDFAGNHVPHKNGWIGAGLLIGVVILVCSQHYNGKRSQYQPIPSR